MDQLKLLIVEDDATSQMMLKVMLQAHALTIVDSGEAGLEATSAETPDLVILDINLPGIDGYETCRRLRATEATHSTPVIFLSSYSDLEDRLQAYGAGGNDYISKPFDANELVSKIGMHSRAHDRHRELGQHLQDSQALLMEVQTSASKIQSISRFIQSTLFCHDIDGLFRQFFKTARDIGLECVLRIHSTNGIETRSIDGNISALEKEILDLSGNMRRIHPFGQDRAIFRWKHATVLTREVGDMIDTLAIFMDALEAGIKSVETESRLLAQVAFLEKDNARVRQRIKEQLSLMNEDVKNTILSLAILSDMDSNDEDKFNDLIDGYNLKIDDEFTTLGRNNQILTELINEMRTPPPELASLMEDDTDEGDGIMLF